MASSNNVPVTIAYGDGIGPEIMEATIKVLREAECPLHFESIEIGAKMYERGHSTGIPNSAWDSIFRTKVLLKAPITTPQGGGYKSLNVTMRKTLGLYANVRPCVSYHPFVKTNHPEMDMVIIRENEEDLYSGIEHRQTDEVYQCLKLISRPGSERIIRYAFEYAKRNGRKKLTCMSKDNIMKMTDGLFHAVFEEVAKEYSEIKTEHYIIDIGSARIASRPGIFDVIVTENLYGDIISDIAAEISGSVGLAGSSNIGASTAMFEAIHGSAPDIAGKNIANPSGLLQAAVMMLVHVGLPEKANLIHNAWLKTIEDGSHTVDIFSEGKSQKKLSTDEFADAVVANLGGQPAKFPKAAYSGSNDNSQIVVRPTIPAKKKELVGVDVFLHFRGTAEELGPKVEQFSGHGVKLRSLTNRGLKVWPDPIKGLEYSDHWRCQYIADTANNNITHKDILALLDRMQAAGFDFIKTENLYIFDGKLGYTAAQGE